MIRVKDLTKKFPDGTVALNRVFFSIEEGEAVAVIGPSGAGKTTLFRALIRSINLDKGAIEVNGLDIYSLPYSKLKRVRNSVGIIYQQHNLVKELSVATNVAAGLLGSLSTIAVLRLMAMGPNPSQLKQVEKCLDEVGIRDKILNRAGNLSGGEQQRVAIARLLMQNPDIILADEPIASVDPVSAERIMDALIGMSRSRGKTLICNIHNVDIARNHFNRILALRNGEIVFDGPPAELSGDFLLHLYDNDGRDDSFKDVWAHGNENKDCGCAGLTTQAKSSCAQEGFCR